MKRTRAHRFLPDHVSRYKDRHGKWRYRFRRAGYKAGHFEAPFGTDEFAREYEAFNNPNSLQQQARAIAQERIEPGTLADLRQRYYSVPEQLGPTKTTQSKIRSVLDRGFFDGRMGRPVRGVEFVHLNAIIAKRKKKAYNEETKRWEGGNEAARKLRKELVRLFDFAEASKMVDTTPMKHVAAVKVPPAERSTGYYTWSEDDISQYRRHWPLGTKQRLAMELLLWTDQRKIDTIHLGRQHIRNGQFDIRQSKTGKELILPVAAPLADAIAAMPKSDSLCFLMTEWGRPFSVKSFGNKFRQWCNAAGLTKCTAHGLRKATMRRMAELEMPNKTMKSVSGHSKDDEVARYTAAADQKRLAQAAIKRLVEWELSNPIERLDNEAM